MQEIAVLHTSDWHLGHLLYKRRRDDEFSAFLSRLLAILAEKHVDVLIVAGDIFDTPMPGIAAQKMYYDFLGRLGQAGVRHAAIIAGNHDSPAFLAAPAGLLRGFNIHVVGAAPENPEDEVITLKNAAGAPELILCAAPYLRDRDLRSSMPGESAEEKDRKLIEGLRAHYAALAALAEERRREADIPVVATGHLFTAGGQVTDGMRQLHVGSLGRAPADIFGAAFDYVALGHIHRAQTVDGLATRRYAGSPLPLGFGETGVEKSVTLVRFKGRQAQVELLPVPEFRQMERIAGSREAILARLAELAAQTPRVGDKIWVEARHDGSDALLDLNQKARELCENTCVDVLCVKAAGGPSATLAEEEAGLEDLGVEEMFRRCLAFNKTDPSERDCYMETFRELLAEYYDSQR